MELTGYEQGVLRQLLKWLQDLPNQPLSQLLYHADVHSRSLSRILDDALYEQQQDGSSFPFPDPIPPDFRITQIDPPEGFGIGPCCGPSPNARPHIYEGVDTTGEWSIEGGLTMPDDTTTTSGGEPCQ